MRAGGGAGDENICARLDAGLARHSVHTAVDLKLAVKVPLVDVAADGGDLGHHVGHELLPAEARLNSHHEHDVALVKERQHGFSARVGL